MFLKTVLGIGNKSENEDELGFFDHLEILRWHIIRSLVSIIVFAVIFFIAKDFTFKTIVFGPKKPDFITYQLMCKLAPSVCVTPPELNLITRELGEQIYVQMSVSFWMGLICSFPYIFWEFWRFVKPGLYPNERKSIGGIVFYCSFLFFLGVSFGYFVIAPFGITWLGSYTVGTEAVNSPTLASYVGYLTMFTIPTGIIFELPIIAYFLGKIGIISSSFLAKFRRQAVLIIFIVAAIVTPPDVVTQILIGIPLLLLYEVSILVLKRLEKNNTSIVPADE